MHIDVMLMRLGSIWTYCERYHSFVTYINALFRFHI